MKIQLEQTDRIVELESDGGTVPARIWQGETESGIRVLAYVTRIMPVMDKDDPRQQEFQDALAQTAAPRAEVNGIPLRLIL